MAKMTDDDDDNVITVDDWIATCTIFQIEEMCLTRAAITSSQHPSSNVYCTTYLKIPTIEEEKEIALIRRPATYTNAITFIQNPEVSYRIVNSKESPVLRVIFYYSVQDDDDDGEFVLESATIEFDSYPSTWPQDAQSPWLQWLQKQVDTIIGTDQISYAVLEFLYFNTLKFFNEEYESLLSDEEEEEESDYNIIVIATAYEAIEINDVYENKFTNIHAKHESTYDPSLAMTLSSLELRVRKSIHDNWKYWVNDTCPICFDTYPLGTMIELQCHHTICKDCLTCYAQTICKEIRQYNKNPYCCPIISCRQSISIVQYIKPCLSKDEMDIIRAWDKDIKYPKTKMLRICPSPKCFAIDEMRQYINYDNNKENNNNNKSISSKTTTCVYCDVCGKTWCELCLKRYIDDHNNCDQSQILQLCEKYTNASDHIKVKAIKKWPWLREYAVGRSFDVAAWDWITQNASTCPSCSMAIERSEGCFHMQCQQCKTHFCYECGEELFPPYYGTHHCWMRQDFVDDT